jgi:hypothetical protein
VPVLHPPLELLVLGTEQGDGVARLFRLQELGRVDREVVGALAEVAGVVADKAAELGKKTIIIFNFIYFFYIFDISFLFSIAFFI